MSRHDRLKKLEANRPAPRPTEAAAPAHEDDLYFYFEQHRRALEGRPLLDPFPYSVEDQRRAAEDMLNDTIPFFASTLGWSTPQGQELLDHWRLEALQTLEDYNAGRLEATDSTKLMIEHEFGGTLPEPANDTHDREDHEE